jgi:hypothetical protein
MGGIRLVFVLCGLGCAAGVFAQAVGQTALLDAGSIGSPGYVQSTTGSVSTYTSGSNVTVEFTSYGMWGGFGRRQAMPWNWAEYDAFAFTIRNLENRPLEIGARVEPTTDPMDLSRVEQASFTLPAGASVPVIFDLKPELAQALGMRGLPPLSNAPHRRLFSYKTLQLNQVHGWWINLRTGGLNRIEVSNIRLLKRPSSYAGVIDSFGQFSGAEWTDKIYSQTDWVQKDALEQVDLARYPGAGGYDGSRQLRRVNGTGRWRTYRTPTGKWYFVHPNGKLFWSFGLCSVAPGVSTRTQGRESLFSSLPPNSGASAEFWSTDSQGKAVFDFGAYNLYRRYGSSWRQSFANRALARVKSWGFNTLGPWSDQSLYASGQLPYTVMVNTNGFPTRLSTPFAYWGKLPDPFASDFRTWMTSTFSSALQGHNGRQTFLGVYVDGELSWGLMDSNRERYQVALSAINASSAQPAKQALLSQLQNKYSSIGALNSAWGTSFASWTSLQQPNIFPGTTLTTACVDDLRQFVTSFASSYYSQVKAALQDAGCTGLYLGARDAWATPETAAAAMASVDVYSVNIYRSAENVSWAFSESTKPVIISEFSFGATDRGSFHPGPIHVEDQLSRAEKLKAYTLAALRSPKVVGVTWFQYADQPASGRPQDGENYNVGLVSISDIPHEPMVRAARGLGHAMYVARGR